MNGQSVSQTRRTSHVEESTGRAPSELDSLITFSFLRTRVRGRGMDGARYYGAVLTDLSCYITFQIGLPESARLITDRS